MEVGFTKTVKNFLIHLDGLPTARVYDLVQNETGVRGWVRALYEDRVEVLILDEGDVREGQVFRSLGTSLSVSVGDFLLGRAINPLGVPIDGKGIFGQARHDVTLALDPVPPGIISREFIKEQFDTGVLIVDSLIPIGKGQRELVLGDARSGKTGFLIDVIVNQKHTNTICIYAAIGKPISEVRSLIDVLKANKALSHTIIVASNSSDSPPLIFLTPQTAFTLAEYFQKQGKDVLIILDDMGTHAKIYREIALLSNRTPGRESYPGDIFYQQAHLLERAGRFVKGLGGGSITALPVMEINLNDFTTFIPTNLMAMTDGHLLFHSSLFARGQRPAIDLALSVSRVGQQTQNSLQNALSTKVKQILVQASQLETVSRFSFELPAQTQLTLRQKALIDKIIRQQPLTNIPKEYQIILMALPFTRFIQDSHLDFQTFLKNPAVGKISQSIPSIRNEEELFKSLEAII